MSKSYSLVDHRTIKRHFKSSDPVLAEIIEKVGPVTLKPGRDRFKMLVRSIVSQQISVSAARSIWGRLENLLKPKRIQPDTIARQSIDRLREAGISRQKAGYLHDLAQKCSDGTVKLARLGRLNDEGIIEELIQVKGIGRWSAQMFLIFSLGRLDVFPLDDLGVKTAIRRLHRFEDLADKSKYMEIGNRWRPYASIGSWYCWRFLEFNPKRKASN